MQNSIPPSPRFWPDFFDSPEGGLPQALAKAQARQILRNDGNVAGFSLCPTVPNLCVLGGKISTTENTKGKCTEFTKANL